MYTGLTESQIIPKSQLAQFLKEVNVSTCVLEGEAFPVLMNFSEWNPEVKFLLQIRLTNQIFQINLLIIILTADIINTLTETT